MQNIFGRSPYFSESDYLLFTLAIIHCSLVIWAATGYLVNPNLVLNQGVLHEYIQHPILVFSYITTIIPCLFYLMVPSWHTSQRMIFVAGIFGCTAIYFFIGGFFLFKSGDLSWSILFIVSARFFYAGQKNI